MSSGNLGPEWGYETGGTLMSTETYFEDSVSIRQFVGNTGLMHSACIDAFRRNVSESGYINSPISVKCALDEICSRCGVESFTMDEIEDLWCAPLNFSEFFEMTRELFRSWHRAMSLDEIIIPEPNGNSQK